MNITVVLFDTMPLKQGSLTDALQTHEDFRILAHETPRAQRCHTITEQAPDLVLLDLDRGDAMEQLLIVKELSAFSQIVVGATAISGSARKVANALAHGATAYFWKQDSIETIFTILKAANRRMVSLDPVIAAIVKGKLEGIAPNCITTQERDVLDALAHGATPEEILNDYEISFEMLYSRLGNVVLKLAVAVQQAPLTVVTNTPGEFPTVGRYIVNIALFSAHTHRILMQSCYIFMRVLWRQFYKSMQRYKAIKRWHYVVPQRFGRCRGVSL